MSDLPANRSRCVRRSASRRHRWARWLCALAVVVAGCLAIPIPQDFSPRFSEEKLAAITKGVTTRDAVIGTLGEPDIRRGEETFYYEWTTSGIVVPWLLVGAGTGGAGAAGATGGIFARPTRFSLMTIEFDQSARVKDVKVDPDSDAFITSADPGRLLVAIRILAPEADDAEAKLFRSLPNRCAIYIYTKGLYTESLGDLTVDNRVVVPVLSSTWSAYYVRITIKPGTHSVQISGSPPNRASLDFSCAAGRLLFLKAGRPWFGSLSLEQVDENEGREGVLVHKRILTVYAEY